MPPILNFVCMQARDIIDAIEHFAPLPYQESYDNSGLQVGDATQNITGVLVCFDLTGAVLEEAVARNCNMIVSHHPLIFSGLKKLTGQNYVARTVQKAIKQDLVLYAAHTNLDNMRTGVNAEMASRLGIGQTTLLDMKRDTLSKLYTFAPQEAAEKVRSALFAAGAGEIGRYRECSFNTPGTGTFKPDMDADPAIGQAGGPRQQVAEVRIEVLVPRHLEAKVLKALFEAHPYEEVAFEFIHLNNANQEVGSGMIGELKEALSPEDFLMLLKEKLKTGCIRYTAANGKAIKKVALCGGSGSFLLGKAMAAGADAFVTGDFKYHQFFDADGRIMIADVGHFESEQFTPHLLQRQLKEKFPNFAILLAEANTNPVNYFN